MSSAAHADPHRPPATGGPRPARGPLAAGTHLFQRLGFRAKVLLATALLVLPLLGLCRCWAC